MGVRGVMSMLKDGKNLFSKSLFEGKALKYDIVFIDGNCFLHKATSKFSLMEWEKKVDDVVEAIVKDIDVIITRFTSENTKVFLVFDGIPPEPKEYCQQKRREGENSISTLLLPNTELMKKIERAIFSKFEGSHVSISASFERGEGEQKMVLILRDLQKKNQLKENSKLLFLSFDSDVIILTLIFLWNDNAKVNIFVKVENGRFQFQIFVNRLKDIMEKKKFDIDRLLFFCIICGNDFFPKLREVKEMTTFEIFQQMTKTNVKTFKDFVSSSFCSQGCGEEDIEIFSNLIHWYHFYFKTNEFCSTKPFKNERTPCCFCVSEFLSLKKEIPSFKEERVYNIENVLNKFSFEKNEKMASD